MYNIDELEKLLGRQPLPYTTSVPNDFNAKEFWAGKSKTNFLNSQPALPAFLQYQAPPNPFAQPKAKPSATPLQSGSKAYANNIFPPPAAKYSLSQQPAPPPQPKAQAYISAVSPGKASTPVAYYQEDEPGFLEMFGDRLGQGIRQTSVGVVNFGGLLGKNTIKPNSAKALLANSDLIVTKDKNGKKNLSISITPEQRAEADRQMREKHKAYYSYADGIDSILKNVNESSQSADYEIDKKHQNANEFWRNTAQFLGNGIGGTLPQMAIVALNPFAGLGIGAASTGGNEYYSALQNKATEDQAVINGILSGAASMAIEKIAGGIPLLPEGMFSFGKLADFAKTGLGKTLLNRLGESLGEGLEEGIQAFIQPYINQISYGKDVDTSALLKDVVENAISGTIFGGILGGGGDIANYVSSYNLPHTTVDNTAKSADNRANGTPSGSSAAYASDARAGLQTQSRTAAQLAQGVQSALKAQQNLANTQGTAKAQSGPALQNGMRGVNGLSMPGIAQAQANSAAPFANSAPTGFPYAQGGIPVPKVNQSGTGVNYEQTKAMAERANLNPFDALLEQYFPNSRVETPYTRAFKDLLKYVRSQKAANKTALSTPQWINRPQASAPPLANTNASQSANAPNAARNNFSASSYTYPKPTPFEMQAFKELLDSNKKSSNNAPIIWNDWRNYEKKLLNGQEYALIGNRLYSHHAVNRMQPSGNRFGTKIIQSGSLDYGRSISPVFVEYVINNSIPQTEKETNNITHQLGSVKVIVSPNNAVITILTYL